MDFILIKVLYDKFTLDFTRNNFKSKRNNVTSVKCVSIAMYLQAPLSVGTNRTSVVAVSPSKGPTTSSSSSEDFCRESASSTKVNTVSYYIFFHNYSMCLFNTDVMHRLTVTDISDKHQMLPDDCKQIKVRKDCVIMYRETETSISNHPSNSMV